MRISDWSSDGCSSDLTTQLRFFRTEAIELGFRQQRRHRTGIAVRIDRDKGHVRGQDVASRRAVIAARIDFDADLHRRAPRAIDGCVEDQHVAAPRRRDEMHSVDTGRDADATSRSEEHTSELKSLMRISYAVFRVTKQ